MFVYINITFYFCITMKAEAYTITLQEAAKIKGVTKQAVWLKVKELGMGKSFSPRVFLLKKSEVDKLSFRNPNRN